MALTVIERKLLEFARDRIREGKDTYICYAIDKSIVRTKNASDKQAVREAKYRLRAYVHDKIKGFATLGSYMADQYDTQYMSSELQREARVAWITWMLGEKVQVDAGTRRKFAIYMNPEIALHSYDSSGHKVV